MDEIAKVFRIRGSHCSYITATKLLSESYAPIMSHILLLASTTGCCSGLCHFTVRAVARSEASFALMARSLKMQSYRVQNLEFLTHSKIIAELVSDTIPQALKAYGY